MTHLVHACFIDAPPDAVWRRVSDLTHWPDWVPTVTGLRAVDGSALRVGHRFAIKQPLQPETVWTVRSVTPGRAFVWSNDVFTAGHTLRAAGAGTISRLDLRADGAAGWVLRPILRLALRAENRALARAMVSPDV